jgi:hypothetical protein
VGLEGVPTSQRELMLGQRGQPNPDKPILKLVHG